MSDLLRRLLAVTRTRVGLARNAISTDSKAAVEPCDVREADYLASAGDDPLTWLRDRLHLSTTELRVLWVLLAQELDASTRRMLREMGTEQVSDVAVGTLRTVVYNDDLAACTRELAPDAPLLRLRLIERTDGDSTNTDYRCTYAVARRVLSLAAGDRGLDPEVARFARFAPLPDAPLVCAAPARRQIEDHVADAETSVVVVGSRGVGKRSLLAVCAQAAGRRVLEIDASAIASDVEIAQRQLRTVAREAKLHDCILLFRHIDELTAIGEPPIDRLAWLEEHCDARWLATARNHIGRRWKRPTVTVELPTISNAERAMLWRAAMPEASESDSEIMANLYPLSPSLIVAAGVHARKLARGGAIAQEHVEAATRTVVEDALTGLAKRVVVMQSWDDLVLEDEQSNALLELVARARHRSTVYESWGFGAKVGRGTAVSALFSGPPGTGKTMAAGILAAELGVALYQVDLSKIVSKWIGETERNLARLFDAAEASHAMLLFDEADALFGKRTEVRSSNDRHANQQVNYLLQRLESFHGICILTSNHENAIDEAFRRRLSIHLRFAVPDVAERKQLWARMLPESAPVAANLNLDGLASRYAMTGGYIRNAVVRAAFIAADLGRPIDAAILGRAAHFEYESIGKIAPSP